ncbi:VOC family protein [Phytoactinopolyspora endophytica]|uniref:VOC family protein n=1 Tax=Phytoactinopolyspora endophytica TaxID=1642495 RepID=UPI00101DE034|nr:VOC family protein [Phytoactinopolyspora endophytica]
MARLRDVVFDCRSPASLARFWAAALDGYRVAPYDDEELARLRSIGIDDPEDDPSVLVEPVSGDGPRVWCNLVPESKVVKNRVHLDLAADDAEAELRRLLDLGASVVSRDEQGWIVMTDPEGNEFCLMS